VMLDWSAAPTCRFEGGVGGVISVGFVSVGVELVSEQAAVALVSALVGEP